MASLDDMALFVEVARTASFTRASARLGMPGATLSRRIAAMEQRLGVRLFDRTTRRVELTDAARRYLERCAHLVDEAGLAEQALRESGSTPTGHLRVSMSVDLGIFWVGPLLPEFARQHPGITLDLDLSSRAHPSWPSTIACTWARPRAPPPGGWSMAARVSRCWSMAASPSTASA